MIISSFKFQIKKAKENLFTTFLLVLTVTVVLYTANNHDTLKQGIAYIFVMWLCSFIIDMYTLTRAVKDDFIVKYSKRETRYFFLCIFLGLILIYFRFFGVVKWEHLNNTIKLILLPLLIFVYPIGLAIIMFLLRYKPKDLGLKLQGIIIALPIIVILAITNRIICPQSFTWYELVKEGGGVMGALVLGFLVAALPEEFFRVIGQTRLGIFLNNKGLAWFIASFLWALLHAPKWYSETHN